MEKKFPSEGVALPYFVIARSRGTTFSLTLKVPRGWTRRAVSSGLGVERETTWVMLSGRVALQLLAALKAARRSGRTGLDGSVTGVASPQVRSTDALTLMKRMWMLAAPWRG